MLLLADSLNCCVRRFSPLHARTAVLYESNAAVRGEDWIESPADPKPPPPHPSHNEKHNCHQDPNPLNSPKIRMRRPGVVSGGNRVNASAGSVAHNGRFPEIFQLESVDESASNEEDEPQERPPSLILHKPPIHFQSEILKPRLSSSLKSCSSGTRHVSFASGQAEKVSRSASNNRDKLKDGNGGRTSLMSRLLGGAKFSSKSKSYTQTKTPLVPFGESMSSSHSSLSAATSVTSVNSVSAPPSQQASWYSLLANADPEAAIPPVEHSVPVPTTFRRPVAVRHVRSSHPASSSESGFLLVVERESRVWPVQYSIAVVDLSSREVRQRHPLPAAAMPSRETTVDTPVSWAPVSADTTSDGSWLVGVAGASALAAFELRVQKTGVLAEKLYTMELGFPLGVFALRSPTSKRGHTGRDIVAVLQLLQLRVILMQLLTGNTSEQRLIKRKLFEIDLCSTPTELHVDGLLFHANTLLLSSRDETRAVHSIVAVQVSNLNKPNYNSIEAGKFKVIFLLDPAAELRIGCWKIVKDKLIVWDSNHLQLLAFECALIKIANNLDCRIKKDNQLYIPY